MKTYHWDWLHVLTFLLAIFALGDSERRVVAPAIAKTWPVAHGTVIRSSVERIRLSSAARVGGIYAHRRISAYSFDVAGKPFSGSVTSWYPLNDATILGTGAVVTIHYRADDPADNVIFFSPPFYVWIEAELGVLLILLATFTWRRRVRSASSIDCDSGLDDDFDRVISLKVPLSGSEG
jgi:hypothetical protein